MTDKGRKLAVQVDLSKHKALWQEIQDGLIAQRRKREPGVPCEDYRVARGKSRPKR